MQLGRHIKLKYFICTILLAVFTIGTLSSFIIYKAAVTSETSAEKNEPVKEKEGEDKYFINIEMPSLVCIGPANTSQPALLSSLYQSVCIEITSPPPDRL
jgi:hypothetical protein